MASDIYSEVGRVLETPIDRSIDRLVMDSVATLQCLIHSPSHPPTNTEREITVAMLPFCGCSSLINRGLWWGLCNPNILFSLKIRPLNVLCRPHVVDLVFTNSNNLVPDPIWCNFYLNNSYT